VKDFPLGVWRCQSGNNCSVTFREQRSKRITISFSWATPPGPEDHEEWAFEILSGALHRALECGFQARAAVEVVRKLLAEGKIDRVGVRKGEWIYSAPRAPGGA
jgi:hypothetical protein